MRLLAREGWQLRFYEPKPHDNQSVSFTRARDGYILFMDILSRVYTMDVEEKY